MNCRVFLNEWSVSQSCLFTRFPPEPSTLILLYVIWNWICTNFQVADWLCVCVCYWISHKHPTDLFTQWKLCTLTDLRAFTSWETDSLVFQNVMMFLWVLCNISLYFNVVYLTTLLVAIVIICQMLWNLINNNLNYSVTITSCSISGIHFRQLEKFV